MTRRKYQNLLLKMMHYKVRETKQFTNLQLAIYVYRIKRFYECDVRFKANVSVTKTSFFSSVRLSSSAALQGYLDVTHVQKFE